MRDAQKTIFDLVKARGYRLDRDDDIVVVKQFMKLGEELTEAAECLRLPHHMADRFAPLGSMCNNYTDGMTHNCVVIGVQRSVEAMHIIGREVERLDAVTREGLATGE